MEPTPGQRRTITVTETARLLGISRTCAYESVRRGELPAIHLGKRIVIGRAAIEAMLNGEAPPNGSTDPTVA